MVRLTFSAETPFGKEAETVGLIQERVFLAKDWLEIAGSNSRAAYRFLVYVLVASSAIKVRDVRVSNLAITDPLQQLRRSVSLILVLGVSCRRGERPKLDGILEAL